jgi:hypothetical protein
MLGESNFFDQYLAYTSGIEPPAVFQRWCAIAGIGALLGRQYYFQHGHFTIYPNTYAMLIGSPGTRKSSAIKLMRSILLQSGYTTIAADKSTKEKFLLDLAGEDNGMSSVDDILDQNLFGNGDDKSDSEMFIMADEFNDFFGNGNIEFVSLLGTLWDFSGVYRNRIKNGKSVDINNPTVSILGGNTPTGFSLAFPTDILGQGFFSRILLIYGEPNGKRIAFPTRPTDAATANLIESLRSIKSTVFGPAQLTRSAERLLEEIYTSNPTVDDVRFASYSNRRFVHLIKLCLIVSASRASSEIADCDVIYANTILTHAEQFMPRALGEFGKGKNSDVTHKVLQVILDAPGVVTMKEIWKHVHADLEKISQLQEILINLQQADKIQTVPQMGGFLPKRKIVDGTNELAVDFSLLTPEERNMKK